MDAKEIEAGFRAIVREFGAYTTQNMRLAEDLYTVNNKVNYDHFKVHRIKQIVADRGLLRPGVRLLDIASLHSMYAIEFALEEMEVISIEGRKANLEKGRFAASALGAKTITFHQDDVNNIHPDKYGRFDVVLCMGILYHIAKNQYVDFLRNVAASCSDTLIIDTFISLHDEECVESNGVQYPGATWREFEEDVSEADRAKSVHSALNHNLSFAMTKPALLSFLGTLGFTTVAEVHVPMQPGQPEDRPTLVCQKGNPLSLRVFPEFNYRRDFDTAADTRGIQGRNVVFWNLPRKPAVEPQQEHIVATVAPPKPFVPESVFGHAVANLLRRVLPEEWIQRIRRMIRGGTNR
jgi:cyclopropane fatty-acyl-phospholipid synthase-like methyltransferase